MAQTGIQFILDSMFHYKRDYINEQRKVKKNQDIYQMHWWEYQVGELQHIGKNPCLGFRCPPPLFLMGFSRLHFMCLGV